MIHARLGHDADLVKVSFGAVRSRGRLLGLENYSEAALANQSGTSESFRCEYRLDRLEHRRLDLRFPLNVFQGLLHERFRQQLLPQ